MTIAEERISTPLGIPETLVVPLDLDRTLFDTGRFYQDVVHIAGQEFGIDQQAFIAEGPSFYVYGQAGLRHYDLFGHVAQLGISREKMEQALLDTMKPDSYLYPDVPEFLHFLGEQAVETCVLTYGQPELQELKLAVSPLLDELPTHIVLEPKGPYLRRILGATARGCMVDDKIVDDLPTGFQQVLLERTADGQGYHSLTEVISEWPAIVTID